MFLPWVLCWQKYYGYQHLSRYKQKPDLDVRDIIVVHNFRFQAGLLATFNYFANSNLQPSQVPPILLPYRIRDISRTELMSSICGLSINRRKKEGYRVIYPKPEVVMSPSKFGPDISPLPWRFWIICVRRAAFASGPLLRRLSLVY